MNKSKISKIILTMVMTTIVSTNVMGEMGQTTAFAAKKPVKVETMADSDMLYGEDFDANNNIEEIASKIREYKKNNPNCSDKELDNYTEELINSSKLRYDLDGYVTGYLNSQEQKLYNSNKTKGLLCMANGKLAIQYSEANYVSSVLHNGNGDAFRHALWNYGMALDVGQSFAKQWSDAHENGTSGNPAIEKSMDLFNNSVGLYQATLNPKPGSVSKMVTIIKGRVDAGGCQIIKNGKLVNSDKSGKK